MEEIVALLGDPAFWIGGVVVSFFTSLMSAYAKPMFDRRLAQFSARAQRAREVRLTCSAF